MPHRDVTLACYKGLLRWARGTRAVPYSLKDKHIVEVFPQFAFSKLGLGGSEAIASLTRTSFRDNIELDEADASDALEAAFLALRILNTHYADQIRSMRETRALHSDRRAVLHPVGQVFVHRRHGYAGVIYGWDAQCGHSPDWAEKMQVKHDQPFYQVLPDEDDCQRLYGSIRITKYVAEENIIRMSAKRRITHRLLENFFEGYSPSQMRYVPSKQVQFQFPDEYEFPDVVPCREDTNLLRSTENDKVEPGPYQSQDDPLRRSMQEMRNSLAAAFKPD